MDEYEGEVIITPGWFGCLILTGVTLMFLSFIGVLILLVIAVIR